MTLETAPIIFGPWLAQAGQHWLFALLILALVALGLVYTMLTLVYGPMAAGERLVVGLLAAAHDVWHTSPRRVGALAWLAIQESLRRRALAGFAIFLVVIAFALWFLDPDTYDPAALYLSFVLWATTILSLVLGLFISVFSLPADMKSKTIYTIVTKPVRATEIVVGRILGFAAIGTVQLAVMGLVSYTFVVRALDHTHELTDKDLQAVEASSGSETRQGRTSKNRGHFHAVTDLGNGQVTTDDRQGHWHPVTVEERNGRPVYRVGAPQGQFHARVPVYGELSFRDKSGSPKAKGTDVGKIWSYRSYVEGGSLEAAVWKFQGLTPDRFPNGLPIDLNIRVFRTRKGDVEQGTVGSLVLRNPRTKVASSPVNFIAKEFVIDRHSIPRKMTSPDGKTLDLFDDLMAEGQLEVQLTCLQRGTFFGMAQADMYLLAREGSVFVNFVKAYVAIWFQMVLVIGFGVVWSTFLNGSVAMLSTFGILLAGVFRSQMMMLAENKVYGGATFESLVRMGKKMNVMEPLDPGITADTVKVADDGVRWLMWLVCQVVPDFKQLSCVDYLTNGFDIPWDRLATHGVTTLGFVVPLFIVGFICFKAREVAA
jgi:ABC-type transport system involved in multi-copper enzyme maturation permease subunit